MTEQHPQQPICKNFFKSGENLTKALFTKKWSQLVNQTEKNACITVKKGTYSAGLPVCQNAGKKEEL